MCTKEAKTIHLFNENLDRSRLSTLESFDIFSRWTGDINFTQFNIAGLLNLALLDPSILDQPQRVIDTLNQAANELGLDQQLLEMLDLTADQQDIIEQYCQNVSIATIV